MIRRTIIAASAAAALFAAAAPATLAQSRILFIHHSTGRNLLQQGEVRATLQQLAGAKAPAPALWDHDYNPIGLAGPDGIKQGYGYGIPDDNTDPDGLHTLWTTANAARDSILSRFDIIAFKSCYEPTNFIRTDEQLQQYKDWYLEIRDELDRHPDKTFVLFTPPPLLALLTNTEQADRARAFATWLGSPAFLDGHPNLRVFDFFDLLAHPDDGSNRRNMLREVYERNTGVIDSHPNELANQVAGPLFAQALLDAAVPDTSHSFGAAKAMFR
ncbi:MAG: hypothetical protein R6X35_06815 [Candidatus Krumholzibacteriia bacterium]